MASTAPLIADYQERIAGVLRDLDAAPGHANATFRKIEALRAQNLDVHPTYGFAVRCRDERYFFRALVRDDAQLRAMRERTTSVLREIDGQLQQLYPTQRPFDVPHVVDAGAAGPVVWDLEEVVDGRHLPCAWNRPSQLGPWLQEAPRQVAAFKAIERLRLDVPKEEWAAQHRAAGWFIDWAMDRCDLRTLPLDEVSDLQDQFHRVAGTRTTAVVHGDPWQRNIFVRDGKVPVILDWDEVHVGEPGEMYGRHWILMCSEPRWQEEVVTAIGHRDEHFWLAFHAYAWARAIDQVHHELVTFQSRDVGTYEHLRAIAPRRAGYVDQMIKALQVLARNPGGPPPGRGQGKPRRR